MGEEEAQPERYSKYFTFTLKTSINVKATWGNIKHIKMQFKELKMNKAKVEHVQERRSHSAV